MRVVDYYFTAGRNEMFYLSTIGDVHKGSVDCRDKELDAMLNTLTNQPNHYWLDMGDKGEFINISDKRYDIRQIHPKFRACATIVTAQGDDYVESVKPYTSRCLGLLRGNHEDAIYKHYHFDIHQYICNGLGAIDLTEDCFINLHFLRTGSSQRVVITIFATHKAGGGTTMGAVVSQLEKLSRGFDAHIYLSAHHHKTICFPEDVIMPKTNITADFPPNEDSKLVMRFGDIKAITKYFAGTGSFFGSYPVATKENDMVTTYAQKSTYLPNTLGWTEIEIIPFVTEGEGTTMAYSVKLKKS